MFKYKYLHRKYEYKYFKTTLKYYSSTSTKYYFPVDSINHIQKTCELQSVSWHLLIAVGVCSQFRGPHFAAFQTFPGYCLMVR